MHSLSSSRLQSTFNISSHLCLTSKFFKKWIVLHPRLIHEYLFWTVLLEYSSSGGKRSLTRSSRVESIFANAPVTRAPELDHDHDDTESVNDGTRKPIEGDCPICVFPMEAGEEELVWCKASCGQNFHKECFDQWKTSKNGGRVTCVYCRAEWQEASPKKGSLAHLVSTAPQVGQYRNIGHHAMYHAEAKAA
jgi:hypothetical protein